MSWKPWKRGHDSGSISFRVASRSCRNHNSTHAEEKDEILVDGHPVPGSRRRTHFRLPAFPALRLDRVAPEVVVMIEGSVCREEKHERCLENVQRIPGPGGKRERTFDSVQLMGVRGQRGGSMRRN